MQAAMKNSNYNEEIHEEPITEQNTNLEGDIVMDEVVEDERYEEDLMQDQPIPAEALQIVQNDENQEYETEQVFVDHEASKPRLQQDDDQEYQGVSNSKVQSLDNSPNKKGSMYGQSHVKVNSKIQSVNSASPKKQMSQSIGYNQGVNYHSERNNGLETYGVQTGGTSQLRQRSGLEDDREQFERDQTRINNLIANSQYHANEKAKSTQMSVPRQGRQQNMNGQVPKVNKVASTRGYPTRHDKKSPSPTGSQMSNKNVNFNSTRPRDNRFDRIGQINQHVAQTQSLGPMSHSSLIGSAQSNSLNQGHPQINSDNYKNILNPQGVAMFKHKELRKEKQRELSQMQNRIKLLQIQEDKIKRRNQIQTQKIQQMLKLREQAAKEKQIQEERRKEMEREVAQRRKKFNEYRHMAVNNRLRSVQNNKLKRDQELKRLKEEKEERKMIIKQIRNPHHRRDEIKNNAENQEESSRDQYQDTSQMSSNSIARIEFKSNLTKQMQKNEQLRKRKEQRQRFLYNQKIKREKQEQEEYNRQIAELQILEKHLMDNCLKQTQQQQEFQMQYDRIMSRGYSKQKDFVNIPRKQVSPGGDQLYHLKQLAKQNAASNAYRPTTQSAYVKKLNSEINSAREGERQYLKSQEGGNRTRAIKPKQIEQKQNNWVNKSQHESNKDLKLDHDQVSYESQDRKNIQTHQNTFITNVEEDKNPDPYQMREPEIIEQQQSAVSINPVAGRINESQTGPQKYQPSPIKDIQKHIQDQENQYEDEEANYYEHEGPEVIVDDSIKDLPKKSQKHAESIQQNLHNEPITEENISNNINDGDVTPEVGFQESMSDSRKIKEKNKSQNVLPDSTTPIGRETNKSNTDNSQKTVPTTVNQKVNKNKEKKVSQTTSQRQENAQQPPQNFDQESNYSEQYIEEQPSTQLRQDHRQFGKKSIEPEDEYEEDNFEEVKNDSIVQNKRLDPQQNSDFDEDNSYQELNEEDLKTHSSNENQIQQQAQKVILQQPVGNQKTMNQEDDDEQYSDDEFQNQDGGLLAQNNKSFGKPMIKKSEDDYSNGDSDYEDDQHELLNKSDLERMQKNLNDSKQSKKKSGASKKSKMNAPNKTFNKTSDKSDDYQDSDNYDD